MNANLATVHADSSNEVDSVATGFDSWANDTGIAARTVARMRARGLSVEWATGDDAWRSRLDEKVGCIVSRGIFRHEEFSAFLDLQGFAANGTEVIVRIRATRLGRNGKLRTEIQVGAYVGGGADVLGKWHEPRFLHSSANDPKVAAARALLGLS